MVALPGAADSLEQKPLGLALDDLVSCLPALDADFLGCGYENSQFTPYAQGIKDEDLGSPFVSTPAGKNRIATRTKM
ncbi:hypothetical protein GH733_016551 [Mirounga leonina]|nr:hypothetical protein GH733_016551 [Mirounga leonina]